MQQIILGDSITEIKKIKSESIHLILSDIPYGIGAEKWDVLHNNTNSAYLGTSPAQQKSNSAFKRRGKPLNGWSEADKKIPLEYYDWCCKWAPDWLRVLKPGGSCFVFAGRRMAHRCICALEDTGFIFKDMLAWQKDAAAHRAQRVSVIYDHRGDIKDSEKWNEWRVGNLKPLFEPILWFLKPYPIGGTLADNIIRNNVGAFNENILRNSSLLNSGKEICSNILKTKSEKTDRGLHPTQKPVALMKVLIELVTIENQVVLDPFCGCGSTLVAAKELNRQYIGIEKNQVYYETMEKRLSSKE